MADRLTTPAIPADYKTRDWTLPENRRLAADLAGAVVADAPNSGRQLGGRPLPARSRLEDGAPRAPDGRRRSREERKTPQALVAQIGLRAAGYNVDLDGIHGRQTDRAARDFQRKIGGAASRPGGIGVATWQGLERALRPAAPAPGVTAREPLDTLRTDARSLLRDWDPRTAARIGQRLTLGDPAARGAALDAVADLARADRGDRGTALGRMLSAAPTPEARAELWNRYIGRGDAPTGEELRRTALELTSRGTVDLPQNARDAMVGALLNTETGPRPLDAMTHEERRAAGLLESATIRGRPESEQRDPDQLAADLRFAYRRGEPETGADAAAAALAAADRTALQRTLLDRVEALRQSDAPASDELKEVVAELTSVVGSDRGHLSPADRERIEALEAHVRATPPEVRPAFDPSAALDETLRVEPGARRVAAMREKLAELSPEDGQRFTDALLNPGNDRTPLSERERGDLAVAALFEPGLAERLSPEFRADALRHLERSNDRRRDTARHLAGLIDEAGQPIDGAAAERMAAAVRSSVFLSPDDRAAVLRTIAGRVHGASGLTEDTARTIMGGVLGDYGLSPEFRAQAMARFLASVSDGNTRGTMLRAAAAQLASEVPSSLGRDYGAKRAGELLMALSRYGMSREGAEGGGEQAAINAAILHQHIIQNTTGDRRRAYLDRLSDAWLRGAESRFREQGTALGAESAQAIQAVLQSRELAAWSRTGGSDNVWRRLSQQNPELSSAEIDRIVAGLGGRQLGELAKRRFDGFNDLRLNNIRSLLQARGVDTAAIDAELTRRDREDSLFFGPFYQGPLWE